MSATERWGLSLQAAVEDQGHGAQQAPHGDPSGSGPWERVRRTLGAQPRPTESEMPICYPSPARCCGQCLRGPDEARKRGPDPRRSARWGPATQRGRQPESCPRKPSPGPPRGTFGGAAWHSNGTLGVKLRIWRWPQCWVTQGPSQREARTEDARALAVRRNQGLRTPCKTREEGRKWLLPGAFSGRYSSCPALPSAPNCARPPASSYLNEFL